jgi:hypothetical protein
MQLINPIDQVRAAPKMNANTYGFTSTRDILTVFQDNGWNVVSSQAARVKDPLNAGYQKHLIKLENPAFQSIEGLSTNNSSKPQLVLLNSHDGTSSLQILWGLLRIACLNGVISGTALSSFRLVHSKRVTERLPETLDNVVAAFPRFVEQVSTLQNRSFTPAALSELTRRVYDARLANVGKVIAIDYRLPEVRRVQDTALDAFTVFNRLQEIVMRGGINYRAERNRYDDKGNVIDTRVIDTTTRRIAGIVPQVNLNRLVYDAALELSEAN